MTPAPFNHREHLRTCVTALRRYGFPRAELPLCKTVREEAARRNAQARFNVTLTLCWTRIVAASLHADAQSRNFDEFLERNPGLLDAETPLAYYSRGVLFGPAARSGWIEPDVRPLPECPMHAGVPAWR